MVFTIRNSRPAFPESFPATGCRFPRLQLRGSAGFSPASHLVVLTRLREPNDVEKEQNRTSRFRSVSGNGKCGQGMESLTTKVHKGNPYPKYAVLVSSL